MHFYPGLEIELEEDVLKTICIIKNSNCRLRIEQAEKIHIRNYKFAKGYNNLINAKMLEIQFVNKIETNIYIENAN